MGAVARTSCHSTYLSNVVSREPSAIPRADSAGCEPNSPRSSARSYKCTFWFVDADRIRKLQGGEPVPAHQVLHLRKGWFVQHTIDLYDALIGSYGGEFLFVSHRWETPDEPDPTGSQLHAVREVLLENPHVHYVYVCPSRSWGLGWVMPPRLLLVIAKRSLQPDSVLVQVDGLVVHAAEARPGQAIRGGPARV